MEVQQQRPSGTETLGRVHQSLRGRLDQDQHGLGTMALDSFKPQVVSGSGSLSNNCKSDGEDGPLLSEVGEGSQFYRYQVGIGVSDCLEISNGGPESLVWDAMRRVMTFRAVPRRI